MPILSQRKLMLMNRSIDALSNFDEQSTNISERISFITSRYKNKDGSQITNTYNNVYKITK